MKDRKERGKKSTIENKMRKVVEGDASDKNYNLILLFKIISVKLVEIESCV